MVNPIIDLFFPPLCILCKAKSRPFLCLTCQDLLTPIDPAHRCRHCFLEIENLGGFCSRCSSSPLLSTPHATLFEPTHIAARLRSQLERGKKDLVLYRLMASLLMVQFSRLDWPMPDRIATLPGIPKAIGEIFSGMLGQIVSSEFCLRWAAPFEWRICRKKKDLMEGENILLLDLGASLPTLREAVKELWPAFPKEVYILSLFDKQT